MKYKNLVVGEQVQVKHNHTEEYCGDHFEEGQVFEVLRVDSDGMFKVEGEQFDFGVGYGRPENFRKYKEPQQEPEPVVEPEQYKVGDIVELSEDCTAKHGERIPKGLYIVGGGSSHQNYIQLDTHHGIYNVATVKTELLTKVGVVV